jgi:KTSC domain-containing protein
MSIFNRLFGKAKPKREPIKGMRGTGGKLSPNSQPFDRWAGLTEEESQSFLDGDPMMMHSSCIGLCQYHPATSDLMIEFKDESLGMVTGRYLYLGVPREKVIEFLRAGSKGRWVSLTLVWPKPGWPFKRL